MGHLLVSGRGINSEPMLIRSIYFSSHSTRSMANPFVRFDQASLLHMVPKWVGGATLESKTQPLQGNSVISMTAPYSEPEADRKARFQRLIEPHSPHLRSLGNGISFEQEGLNVALQAFFDESGKLCPGSHVAFGGCAALADSWSTISNRWYRILEPHGITSVSMKDAMRFKGSFAGWEDRQEERDSILCDLVKAAVDNIEFFVAFTMSTDEFALLSAREREQFINPVYCGFAGCMKQLLDRSSRFEPIQICCDNSEAHSEKFLRLYHDLRRDNPEFKKRCGNITFGEDQSFTGLQLADIHVYCVRHLEWNTGETDPLVAKLMALIEPDGHVVDTFVPHPKRGLASGALARGRRIVKP